MGAPRPRRGWEDRFAVRFGFPVNPPRKSATALQRAENPSSCGDGPGTDPARNRQHERYISQHEAVAQIPRTYEQATQNGKRTRRHGAWW